MNHTNTNKEINNEIKKDPLFQLIVDALFKSYSY